MNFMMVQVKFLLKKQLPKSIHLMFCMILLFSFTSLVSADNMDVNRQVSGIVKDKTGETLIGVSVTIKGTSIGTLTDIDGKYSLNVADDNSILLFTYVGYDAQEIKVGSQNTIDITLTYKESALDEVVIVGYGVQKKKLITGATLQVKGDDVERLNTMSALGALQSQSPGVNITQSSGMPGSTHKVIIRGLGTNGDSGPLYVIDGSPGGDINLLNPADIESIDVLKDAASAAIYGSRSANGIIIVTTKTGKKGKAKVSFDAYYGMQNVYKMPDILNAQQYVTIMNETRLMDNLAPYDFAQYVPNWEQIENGTWKGTNWLDEARNKNAPIQNYSLNVSGGSDLSVYSLGLSYASQEGIIAGNNPPKHDRYTARINSDHIIYKRGSLDIVKLGETLTYAYSKRNGMAAIGDMWSNDIRNLVKSHPLMPVYDENANAYGNYSSSIPWEMRSANPLARMDTRSHNETEGHNVKGNVFAVVQPIKNLRFKTNFGYIYNSSSYRSFIPEYQLSTTEKEDLAYVSQSMATSQALTFENTLNYVFTLKEKHNFDALLGQSLEKANIGHGLSAANGDPIFNSLKYAYLVNAQYSGGDPHTAISGVPLDGSRIASFFGRVNYDYDNKYMFTAIMRADGSSRFARDHRWGYFPSFSAGWVVSSEPFMSSVANTIDFLKVRASWGQNGNQNIPAFQYSSTYALTGFGDYFFGGDKTKPSRGAYPDIMANEVITWETSEQTDLGIDARFLKSRLGLTFDYYIKKTKDWLVDAPQLASYGTKAAYINGGEIENKGVELSLNWNDNISDFRYSASVNMSYNKNKVVMIKNDEGIIHGLKDDLFQNSLESYRAQVGQPIGMFYGYKTAGVFQTPEEVANYKGAKLAGAREGDVIWVDRNGDGIIDDNDKGMIGNPNPDVTMGINLWAGYKGFDIGLTFYGAFGHQIYQSYRSWSDQPKENHVSKIFDRWHGPGTSNKYPRLSTQAHTNWTNVSDLYVEDGDYMRLQNLTIGYDFKQLFPSLFLEQARVYFTAQNLFTITGYSGQDPEVGYGPTPWTKGYDLGFYPSPRTYMFGVNLKF